MKKIILTMALAALTLSACYDDKSGEANTTVPTIGVLDEQTELRYSVGQAVDWAPELAFMQGGKTVTFTEGDYADYDYFWRVTRTTDRLHDTTRVTVSSERALKTTIDLLPTPADKRYNMALYMRNKTTGMEHSFYWEMAVTGEYGGGVLVADTRDGGASSDISFIKSYHYNDGQWPGGMRPPLADVVWHNLYSTINGATIDGTVSSMAYVGHSSFQEVAVVARGKSLLRLSAVTMKKEGENQQLFFYAPATWNPQMVFSQPRSLYGVTCLINDGKPHFYRGQEMQGRYSAAVPTDNDFEVQEGIVVPVSIMSNINALMWDKAHGRIMTLNAAISNQAKGSDLLPAPAAGSLFDPGALGDFDCLYAGYLQSVESGGWMAMHHSAWLLKHKGTGALWIYELDTSEVDVTGEWDFEFQVKGVAKYDMSGCPDLAQATCYVTSQDYHEFFYAVGNKIYFCHLSGNAPTAELRYEAPAGEVITHMDFDQCLSGMTFWNYMGVSPFPQWSQNNVLTIATWDGTEGRIRALPRQYAGDGRFADPEFHSMWGGFGQITAINVRE